MEQHGNHNMQEDVGGPRAHFEFLAEKINKDLRNAVTNDFPPNLYNPMRYVLSSEGKRFRPILLIMACEAVGGALDNSYNASLAIEILHSFTLVHDDIMDDDDLRRGRSTVHKKWDESIAILTGDGLIALAYRYLLKTKSRRIRRIIKIFSEAIINICEGQSLDKDMEQVPHVTLEDYIYMIERKTGVLMAVSAEMGGLLGVGNQKQIAALKNFGLEMGIAFQIQDDLLDIISEEIIIGKDFGSDLAQGKKTYPIIAFLDRASKRDAVYVEKMLRDRNADHKAVMYVQSMLKDHGIVEATQSEVSKRLDKANSQISALSDSIETTHLFYLSRIIRNRKF